MKKLLSTLTLILFTSGLLAAQTMAPPAPADPPPPPDPPQIMAGSEGGFVGHRPDGNVIFGRGAGRFMAGQRMGMMGGPGMGMRGPGRGMWWLNPRLAKRLGLTDDQVTKIKKIFQDHRLQLIDLHANLEKQEVLLRPMINADHPDENAALAQIDKVAEARASLEKSNARMLFAIRDTLTPEQWQKLRAMRTEMHRPRPGARRGFRQGRPGRMMMRQGGGNTNGQTAPPAPPAPPADGGGTQ